LARPPAPRFYWSELALSALGSEFSRAEPALIAEVAAITAQTQDWLFHVYSDDSLEDGFVLVCNGRETSGAWEVIVQLAEFRDIETEPGEELPSIDGMTPQFPYVLPDEPNHAFYVRTGADPEG
jgi:hypothetical protein